MANEVGGAWTDAEWMESSPFDSPNYDDEETMVDKLNIYEFGQQLLETKDIDPVYVVLWEAKLEPDLLRRWLLSYFCFYNVGTASQISDEPLYWKTMEAAAASKDWARGSERRHYRGQAAIKSMSWLRGKGLSCLFKPFDSQPTKSWSLGEVMDYVRTWVGFGPWISFKVADMLERLNIAVVEFSDEDMYLFKSPQEAAMLLYEIEQGGPAASADEAQEFALQAIHTALGRVKAPPRYERTINAQEAETILCKWGSYTKGHYKLGKDIQEIKHALHTNSKSKTAQRLLRGGASGGLW